MKRIYRWLIVCGLWVGSVGLAACSGQADTEGQQVAVSGSEETGSMQEAVVADYQGTLCLQNQDNPYKEILDTYYRTLYERQTASDQNFQESAEEYKLVNCIVNPYWSWESAEDILSKEGYAFMDLNDDGVEELLLGWVGNEFWNMDDGYVFAIYTLVDDEPVLAVEGWERCLYVVGEDGYLYRFGSSSAWEGSYTKCKFNKEYEDYLEPLEELYSYYFHNGENAEPRWKYREGMAESEATDIDQEIALVLGEGWMESGRKLDYTLFSGYE